MLHNASLFFYLLTCLAPTDYKWTYCMYILDFISVLRSVNVRWKSPLCAVDICALCLEKVKLSHATIIWIPFGSTRCILECYLSLMPLPWISHLFPIHPRHTPHICPPQHFPGQICIEVQCCSGEEEKCRWFLVLSPSVWDFQTNFEPWSFWSFFIYFLFTITVSLFYPPLMPCSSSFPFSDNLTPPSPPSLQTPPLCVYCTVWLGAHPSLSVYPSPSVCVLVCCFAAWVCFFLPRVLSPVPILPVLSFCL